jgi:hypothetical protein
MEAFLLTKQVAGLHARHAEGVPLVAGPACSLH